MQFLQTCTKCKGQGALTSIASDAKPCYSEYPGAVKCGNCEGTREVPTQDGLFQIYFLKRYLWDDIQKEIAQAIKIGVQEAKESLKDIKADDLVQRVVDRVYQQVTKRLEKAA
jgi:hypothetical protein